MAIYLHILVIIEFLSFFSDADGPLNLYNDQLMHVHYGISADGDKDQCINSKNFARFLGFLESIPFHHTGLNDHGTPDSRYIHFLVKFFIHAAALFYCYRKTTCFIE